MIILTTVIILLLIFYLVRKRKFPIEWENGDIIDTDPQGYLCSFKITHIIPNREKIILDDKYIKTYSKLKSYNMVNLTLEKKIEEKRLNQVKQEAEDYTEALKELKQKYEQ